MPKVSIIMGTYNCEGVVTQAIDSILAQTFGDWEFIICDDGSTDNTWGTLIDYVGRNPKFILLRNIENHGLAAVLNRCIDASSGEYLARQDADDISVETRLEEQVAFLDRNNDVSVLGTYGELFHADGNCWGEIKSPEVPEKKDWIRGASVVHASVLMRKKDVLGVGKYDEKIIRVEDYDLWTRMISKGYRIRTLPRALYKICWGISDYSRRKFKYRLIEARVRLECCRRLNAPLADYIYIFKPLVIGIMPLRVSHLYHNWKFRKIK